MHSRARGFSLLTQFLDGKFKLEHEWKWSEDRKREREMKESRMNTQSIRMQSKVNCLLIERSIRIFALGRYLFILTRNYQSETYLEFFPFIEIDT